MGKHQIQISFEVSEFTFDPSTLTDLFGIEPFSTGIKGMDDPVRGLPRMNFWAVRSTPIDPNASLDAHWLDLIDKLREREELIARISETATVTFFIIVGQTARRPILKFSDAHIRFVASCRARLEID